MIWVAAAMAATAGCAPQAERLAAVEAAFPGAEVISTPAPFETWFLVRGADGEVRLVKTFATGGVGRPGVAITRNYRIFVPATDGQPERGDR